MIKVIIYIYFLVKSHFLGFSNMNLFLIYDVPIYDFVDLFLIIFVIHKFISDKSSLKRLKRLKYLFFFFIFFLFNSIFMLNYSIRNVVIDFSDFWSFSFLLFLIQFNIPIRLLKKIILQICLLASFVFLINQFSDFSIGVYKEREIPLVLNAVLPLSILLIITSHYSFFVRNFYCSIVLLVLFISEFRSLFFISVFIILYNNYSKIKFAFVKVNLLLLILIFSISQFNLDMIKNDNSLVSRAKINSFRIEKIFERPLLGYSFVGKTSSIFNEIDNNSKSNHDSTLKTIDSGYIDLSLRFGLIGAICYFFILFKLGKFNFKFNNIFNVMFVLYMFVNFTLSVFSFSFGLLAISCIIYLNISKNENFTLIK